MGFIRNRLRKRKVRPVTMDNVPLYYDLTPLNWEQVGDNDWYTTTHSYALLVTYDDEFDAFDWRVTREADQHVVATGMARDDSTARFECGRALRLYQARIAKRKNAA